MKKHSQYYDQPRSPFQSLADYASLPIGLGIGAYGLNSVWQGSPALRYAMAAGAPYALYKYLSYNNPANMASDIGSESKRFYDQIKSDPNGQYIPQDQVNQARGDIQDKVTRKYYEPAKSALYDAIPLFALGAAAPSLLNMLKHSSAGSLAAMGLINDSANSRINRHNSKEEYMNKTAKSVLFSKIATYCIMPGGNEDIKNLAREYVKSAQFDFGGALGDFGSAIGGAANSAMDFGSNAASSIASGASSLGSAMGQAASDILEQGFKTVEQFAQDIIRSMPEVPELKDLDPKQVVDIYNAAVNEAKNSAF